MYLSYMFASKITYKHTYKRKTDRQTCSALVSRSEGASVRRLDWQIRPARERERETDETARQTDRWTDRDRSAARQKDQQMEEHPSENPAVNVDNAWKWLPYILG